MAEKQTTTVVVGNGLVGHRFCEKLVEFDPLAVLEFEQVSTAGIVFEPITVPGSDDDELIEEIVVQGSRATIQSTINIRRNSTTIVDGLSAVDIGDLPALSIGEALESIVGVASHRENGGATEISIRGLGPFLSATFSLNFHKVF